MKPLSMNPLCKTPILADAIFTLDDLFTAEECDRWIQRGDGMGFDAAPITTALGFQMRPEVRNNTRVMFDDVVQARELWSRLATCVPERLPPYRASGINERFRLYRYERFQYFRWHCDGAFVRNSAEQSLLTLMVYLNDDFEGGTTEFATPGGVIRVVPRRGLALLFEHPFVHQGAPVARGTKYVLRSDVMYRVGA